MSPNTGCFVCSIFLLWIPVIQGTYFVSENNSYWRGAKDCAFANPPPINFTEEQLTVQVTGLNIATGGKVWIGYFRKTSGFEYIGCASFNDTNFLRRRSKKISEPNPGKCYSACKYSDITGVTKNKCFCVGHALPRKLNMTYPYCTSECEDVACGGTQNRTLYISLYRFSLNATHIAKSSSLDLCIALEPISNTFLGRNCSSYTGYSSLQVMCSNGQSVWKVKKYDNWLEATASCFRNSSRPTQYSDSKPANDSDKSPLWTGMIKSRVIYTFNDQYDDRTNIEFGYLEYNNDVNNHELKFQQRDAEQNYLCSRGSTEQPTSTTSRRTTTSSVTTTFETSSALTTPTTLTTTSTLTSRTVSTETDSEVGAVIGASIVSVLVVIAVVVVIVILKKRKKLPSLCKEAVPAKEFGYQQPKRKTDEISRENHDYDHANVDSTNTVNISSDSNYAHTYFVLEPHVNESNTDNTTYDNSGNANKTITEPDNVYNRLKTDNNQTYDHAHTKIRNGVLKFDDTYDTTDKAAMKLKARPGKDLDAFGETDEDAYNHITSKPVTNTKTENEYGVPNTLENAYGDVVANNKNNTPDGGDTYSHINNKPQNKEKQGNPFSISKQMYVSKLSEENQDADYDVTDGDDKLLTTDNDYSTIGTVN